MIGVVAVCALVGLVLGIAVVQRSDPSRTVFGQMVKAIIDAAVVARSPREFFKLGWKNGHDIAIAMFKNQRASLGVVGMVMTVIVAAIAILIGIIVYANVSASMPTANLDNQTQQMITNLNTNVNSSFTLLAVGIIVLAASFILTVLIVALGRAGQ